MHLQSTFIEFIPDHRPWTCDGILYDLELVLIVTWLLGLEVCMVDSVLYFLFLFVE